MTAQPDRVAVIVPARDEESTIGACLTAIATAQQRLSLRHPAVRSVAIVVLDDCRDQTDDVVRRHPAVLVVHCRAGKVGTARRLGVARALEHLGGNPASCWIASTDADSTVPPNWLVQQLDLARQGAELVLGTVLPDRNSLPPETFDEWSALNPTTDGHPYVHGANLGIRGDAYLRAGGFAEVGEHEDVLLARAVRDSGGQVVSTASCPVSTSGRTVGRTPGGFAGYLAALVT